MRFDIQQDCALAHATGGHPRHILASVEAPLATTQDRRSPVNLAFVIDRSGSMEDGKLDRAKQAVQQALRTLGPEDHFSVVAYDHVTDVLVPSCSATAPNRARAEFAVSCLEPRGMTNLFDGCIAGCEQVAMHLQDADIGRCLVLTDGFANRGLLDHDEIVQHLEALRQRRIATTTFGVGTDFDETLLRRMAEAGGGNFYFIASAAQIADMIASEVGEALEVVARDVVLVLDAPAGTRIQCLNDYPVRNDEGGWRIEIGALVSGQTLDVVLSVDVPAQEEGSISKVVLRLEDSDGVFDMPEQSVVFTSAPDYACSAQTRVRAVDRKVAGLHAARVSREALELNRAGDYGQARKILVDTSEHIRGYAEDDPELLAIAQELELRVAAYSRRMEAGRRKKLHHAHHAFMKDKDPLGRVTRNSEMQGVVLLSTSPELEAACLRVTRALSPHAAPFLSGLSYENSLANLRGGSKRTGGLFEPREEAQWVIRAQTVTPSAAVRILITEFGFGDNWFSHWHPRERTAVISTHNWDVTASVSVEALIAYETLLYGMNVRAPDTDPLALVHEESRGCMFDFCRLRSDIEIKLQAMDLCPSCRRGLLVRGIEPQHLSVLCEAVRSLARPSSQRLA